jgi:hypothetical protein
VTPAFRVRRIFPAYPTATALLALAAATPKSSTVTSVDRPCRPLYATSMTPSISHLPAWICSDSVAFASTSDPPETNDTMPVPLMCPFWSTLHLARMS